MYHSFASSLFCVLLLTAPTPIFQDRTPDFAEPQEIAAPKLSEGIPLHGTVLTPEGFPATDATLALATGKNIPHVHKGKIITVQGKEHYVVQTDRDGKFAFEYIDFQQEQRANIALLGMPVIDYAVIILHDTGTRYLLPEEMEAAIIKRTPITLERWGRVEGTIYTGTKPAKGIDMDISLNHRRNPTAPFISWSLGTVSDANGLFVFEQVPPGSGAIRRGIRTLDMPLKKRVHSIGWVGFDLRDGETLLLDKIGGDGRPVIGKIVLKDTETEFKYEDYLVQIRTLTERFESKAYNELYTKTVPESIRTERDYAKKNKMLADWETTTEEGRTFAPARRKFEDQQMLHAMQRNGHWKLSGISPEGTFRIDDVPAGDWQLTIVTVEGRLRVDMEPLLKHRFEMPVIPNGVSDDPLDVGTLTLVLE
jgi:hypothetical protein